MLASAWEFHFPCFFFFQAQKYLCFISLRDVQIHFVSIEVGVVWSAGAFVESEKNEDFRVSYSLSLRVFEQEQRLLLFFDLREKMT